MRESGLVCILLDFTGNNRYRKSSIPSFSSTASLPSILPISFAQIHNPKPDCEKNTKKKYRNFLIIAEK